MRGQIESFAQALLLLATFVIVDVQGVVVANGATSNNDGGHQIGSDLVKQRRALVIIPTPSNSQNIIVKRIGETLNLTCLIKYNTNGTADGENRSSSSAEHSSDAKLSWYLPLDVQNSLHRTSFHERSRGALTVIVTNLKEADSGTYGCEARDFDHLGNFDLMLTTRVEVTVKPKKNSCGEQSSFACSTGECIPKRFVCDGRNDCKEGSDESSSTCGSHNPCDGKLRCGDGRCISPQWCCDRTDPNCTTNVSPACCKQLPIPFMDVSQYPPQSQQFSDMGFLQTTIYTVIGCAMAFMFIITIMVIAICRVHLKRTNLPRYPHHLNQTSQRQDSWGNIFLHSSGSGLPYTSAASGLLVTYNINNGVQFVGRPVNPPPYSEIVRAPPREGPPPPYASHENIATTSASSTPTTTVSSSAVATANGSNGLSSTIISTNPQPLESQRTESPTSTTAISHIRRPVYSENDEDEPAAEPLLSENNNGDINGNSTSEVTVEPDSNVLAQTAIVALGNTPADDHNNSTSNEQHDEDWSRSEQIDSSSSLTIAT